MAPPSFRESRRATNASLIGSGLRQPAAGRTGVRQTRSSTIQSRSTRATSQAERARPFSPAESVKSISTGASAGQKRKERDFELEGGGEETNINVVVRCRGRNDREVRENSAVVISTEGIKGKAVHLSMGPNSLSNKTYTFDQVFSPAADQSIIFEDVVKPIVEEVCCCTLANALTFADYSSDDVGLQLHNICIWSDRHG